MASVAPPFSVLSVCLNNVCRSPVAELVMAAQLGAAQKKGQIPAGLVVVSSAGTHAQPGAPLCPEASGRLHEDPDSHYARRLEPAMVAHANLVIAAERHQRGNCARLWPQSRPYSFTLRQAAALATGVADRLRRHRLPHGAPDLPNDPTARLHWLVSEMDAARGTLAGWPKDGDEIADGHSHPHHGSTVRLVRATADALAAAMLVVVTQPLSSTSSVATFHRTA